MLSQAPPAMDAGAAALTAVDPKGMTVLVTSEQGYHAPGIEAMVCMLVSGGFQVQVCVPDCRWSIFSHSAVCGDEKLLVRPLEFFGVMAAYSCTGTPADCVSLGLSGALFDTVADLVVSGINQGCTTGYQIVYSGTVAGAREAFLHGVPSVSVSYDWLEGKSTKTHFFGAAKACEPLLYCILREIKSNAYPKISFLKIDVPTEASENKGFIITEQSTSFAPNSWVPASPDSGTEADSTTEEASPAAERNEQGTSFAPNSWVPASPDSGTEADSTTEEASPAAERNEPLLFKREVKQAQGVSEASDYKLLKQGYVTVTPLGVLSRTDDEFSKFLDKLIAKVRRHLTAKVFAAKFVRRMGS